ncbi:MAG TPA: hypothetical protein DEQ50_09950 [Lactobacillus sp.]|nr:hypothetical protein [Lactobacillus sp.]
MNKKKLILASTLAILIAPSILGNVSTSTSVKADTINNPIGINEYINKKNVEVIGTFTDIDTPVNTTINLYNSSAILDDNGNNTGKTLPANSSWHADQTKAIHNYLYYRVATNEWVSNGGYNGSKHIFADYTNGNTIENGIKYAAALEPTFATDISK